MLVRNQDGRLAWKPSNGETKFKLIVAKCMASSDGQSWSILVRLVEWRHHRHHVIYMNQCRLIISEVLCQSYEGNFTASAQDIYHIDFSLKMTNWYYSWSPWGQWMNSMVISTHRGRFKMCIISSAKLHRCVRMMVVFLCEWTSATEKKITMTS